MPSIVFDQLFLKHETGHCGLEAEPAFFEQEMPSHPECRERLLACIKLLEEKGKFNWVSPEKISEKQLLIVHEQPLIDEIKKRSGECRNTNDNVFNKNTFEIAKLACGAALKAAGLSEKGFAFSLARPPGHHAGRNFFGGFCYFNNIAFAIRSMQREKGFKKAMIVDFDLHHGNGTQDIFSNDESVYYISLHQDPVYAFPGTGFRRDNNAHVKNVPLELGTTDAQYLRVFSKEFNECFQEFSPEIIGVSAGFDVFASESAIGCRLAVKNHETFFEIAKTINKAAAKEKTPCFGVLEGGYNLRDLPLNLLEFLNGFE